MRTHLAGARGAAQRFGSALNLNIRFHMLFPDGVYIESEEEGLCFRQAVPPTAEGPREPIHRIVYRVTRYLERQGLLEGDVENGYLNHDEPPEAGRTVRQAARLICRSIASRTFSGNRSFGPWSRHALTTRAVVSSTMSHNGPTVRSARSAKRRT